MSTDDPDLTRVTWPVNKAALCLLEWYETTHGNEFGHDHHCRGARWQSPGKMQMADGTWFDKSPVQVEDPEQPCTCGWRAFQQAYDEMHRD